VTTGSAAAREAAVPTRLNLAIGAAVGTADLVVLFGAPALLVAGHAWAVWIVLLFPLVTVPQWALVHEAVHGHLHPHPGVNDRLGRVLAVLFLAPFDTLRFGHLSHHALNAQATEWP
jgi:fatty acid desaturase